MALIASVAGPLKAEQPQVGDIFESGSEKSFRSWTLRGGGLGVDDQPFAVFQSGEQYMVAITSPVVRGPEGGIEVEKITSMKIFRAQHGEEILDGGDCWFVGLMPALVFYDSKTQIARGIFARKDEPVEKRWFASRDECQYGGD